MRRYQTYLLIFLALQIAVNAGAQEVRFERLLAFAGTNQVRIECELAPGFDDVALTGVITRAQTGEPLWQGALGQPQATGKSAHLSHTVSQLKPALWEPTSPTLYNLEVTASRAGQKLASKAVRFGFRSFEIRNGQFHLNGRPVFLRGVAINPPGRTIPDATAESRPFAEAYVRFLKSQNLNIFRISTDESQVWFDVCDELGMMLYAGRYGAPVAAETLDKPVAVGDEPEEGGKQAPPKDFAKSLAGYKQLFSGYASHPSIVEYYLSNELPHNGPRGEAFSAFLTKAIAELKRWDNTRPYIGNAGYGMGREGDVCDVHRYWGWYYNSFLTYYNLRDRLYPQPLFGDLAKNQPLTFTECVGSFTGSSGEINVIRSKQLAPRLGWIGHTEAPREDALGYQSFMVKQATESFRRMRPLNPRLAGIMPFTILFYNWSGITSFDQMQPKPAMAQMALSYQPVLLSWESWTPQVYAGNELRPIAHIINDDDRGCALAGATLTYGIRAKDDREFCRTSLRLPDIRYFGTWSKALSLALPADLPTGEYLLTGSVATPAGVVSTNFAPLFIAGGDWAKPAPRPESLLLVYDPPGRTAAALDKLGLKFQRLRNLTELPAQATALVIGENAWDKSLAGQKQTLQHFVQRGGRVLCLPQDLKTFDATWLPAEIQFFTSSPNDTHYPPRTRPFREQMNINPERPDHPVFRGLDRHRLSLWSDYTGWNQTKRGFPKVYPVSGGFKLTKPEALSHTAILADYDRGLEGIALCEMFDGDGSVILTGFDLVNRAGLDPVADRLLANLATYAAARAGHDIHPLIEQPIRWGDFPSERGTVCGSLNGLLVNAEWLVPPTNPSATPLAANTGAWNMKPGDQFVPRGRNPFGEYGYSTASSLKDPNPDAKTGSGFFWARIPAGKRFVVTTVRNPEKQASTLTVAINDASPTVPATVAAGQTAQVRTPLPAGATSIRVQYAGGRTLVLVETAFE